MSQYVLIGEGNSNPLQFSCLENPMDRGAWQATVHRVSRIGYDLATKERERDSHDDKYTSKLEQLTETKSLSPVWLCDPKDYTVHGILQARILEWVAFPFSRGSSQPRDWTQVSHTAGEFFTSWATKEALGNK